MHIRRAILEHLRSQIKSVSQFNGAFIQRIGPRNTLFPHVTLYAESDTVETLTIHEQPRPQDRALTVSVVAWVRGTPDDEKAESDLDNAAELIEQILETPTHADEMVLVSTDFEVSDDEPEIHLARLTYSIQYQSVEWQPDI